MGEKEYTAERLKYLTLLAEGYPTVQALCTEIVNLEAHLALPKGTNTEKPNIQPKNTEDTWMTARNKWLLAHAESDEAKGGAHIGLRGINIDIADAI